MKKTLLLKEVRWYVLSDNQRSHEHPLLLPLPVYKWTGPLQESWLKAIRIMRWLLLITVLICCTAFTLYAGNVKGQSVLDKEIDITLKDELLKTAIDKLAAVSGVRFSYSDEVANSPQKVSISVKKTPLKKVLNEILMPIPFKFLAIEGEIVVWSVDGDNFSADQSDTKYQPLDKTISGVVTDSLGMPLPGVTVQVKGTNIGTATNINGEYFLSDIPTDAVLLVSMIGYQSQSVVVGNRSEINIILKEKLSDLDEALVIGYGTTSKRLKTGSISKITDREISKQPISNPLSTLQGLAPGLQVTQHSGIPGSGFDIQIRGQNSIASGNEPLYIIDGVPFNGGSLSQISNASNIGFRSPFNSLNPSDIKSIEILKDADATAIYGSRGANGVILISTKKGEAGKTNVQINAYSGIGKVNQMMEFMNTRQYLDMRYETLKNDGTILTPTAAGTNDLTKWDTTRYTNWREVLIGNTAHMTDIQAVVSGGSSSTQFRVSGGYHKETSVYPGDIGFDRISLQSNITHTSTDKKFKMLLTGNFSSDRNDLYGADLAGSGFAFHAPNAPTYDDTGAVMWVENGYRTNNPLGALFRTYAGNTDNLIGNIKLNYQLLPNLLLKLNSGYTNMQLQEEIITPVKSLIPLPSRTSGNAQFAMQNFKSWITEPQVEYVKNIGKGNLSMLLGSSWQQETKSGYRIFASDYSNEALLHTTNGASTITTSTSNSLYRYNSIFGRINFNWADTYILNVTGRRDGSSRFGPGKQFSNFGAAGISWIFSTEPFIKNSLPFLSFGKLRSSYGSTGNDKIGDYQYLDLYTATRYPYQESSGLVPSKLYNTEYAWEVNRKLEAAVELGFLHDRILFSVNYFRNRSSNQLLNQTLPVQTGFAGIIRNLPALVENAGWEFELNTINMSNDKVQWNTGFNLTHINNKLLSYPGLEHSNDATKYEIDRPLNIQKLYHYTGVDPETGVYTFEDVNGDETLTNEDRVSIINLTPEFYGGLKNSFQFGRLKLDFLFYFVKQLGRNYLGTLPVRPGQSGYNVPVALLGRWQSPGDIAEIQRFTSQSGAASTAFSNFKRSDGAFTDASYIRLRNLSLSYRVPEGWFRKANGNSFQVYIQAQNLFTITGYKGNDPEVGSMTTLPPLRFITGGIQISL